jgi:hypothetical protein
VHLKAKSGNESDATEFSEDGTFAAAPLARSEELFTQPAVESAGLSHNRND